jgi:acyl CoA:acetate/3-ketoacid CoA transferase beta subunit
MIDAREIIARRIGMELRDGDLVNLGIGIPTQYRTSFRMVLESIFSQRTE